jgi:putative transcriptional regulator
MSITHHPNDELLAEFSSGRLDGGKRLVLAVHISACRRCGRFVSAMEAIGGQTLEASVDVSVAPGAFERTFEAASDERGRQYAIRPPEDVEDGPLPVLIRRHRIGKRRRIAPGVSVRPILLPYETESRVFLLRSAPGTRMLEHTHSGSELTCVLQGSFAHAGGHFLSGDFDYGDGGVDHAPVVGDGDICICLVAMSGDLRPNGWLGKLIAPFVRI